MTRPVITYSGPVEAAEVVREVAGARFDIQTVPPEPDAVASGLKSASAFLDASMKVRLTEAMIAAAPDLRLVVTATTGADHIDAAALERRGIPLLTLKGQREVLSDLTPAAEHSWLLLMAGARRLPSAHAHVLGGGWNRTDFPGMMLKGKTLGIVGCGRLGRWMARYGAAFGMRCRGYDPYLETWPAGIEPRAYSTPLILAFQIGLPNQIANRSILSPRQRAARKWPNSCTKMSRLKSTSTSRKIKLIFKIDIG